MATGTLDEAALSQFWPNVMSMLILAAISVSVLVLTPWGIDPMYSGLSHFLTFWPLLLLAILTYVAKVKLDDQDREVPE